MFPAYPRFENLPLHVDVEWQGRTRPVVARLTQWPLSHHAVLECAFEDDETDGEWLVTNGRPPYRLDRADKLLYRTTVFDVKTHQPQEVYRWKDESKARMEEMVKRGFEGERNSVARVLDIGGIPQEPRLALWCRAYCLWISGTQHWNWVEFEQAADLFLMSQTRAHELLLDQWNQPDSPARFAWDWARLSDEERFHQIAPGCDWDELKRVMTMVLRSNTRLWQTDACLWWSFIPVTETGELEGVLHEYERNFDVLDDTMRRWNRWLIKHFARHWRADWFRQYSCVRDFVGLQHEKLGAVTIEQAPTAHEQLEAKLQLREWLRNKATPAEIKPLLDSLNN